jgi:tetratricopeptide (TPR) repeat protein
VAYGQEALSLARELGLKELMAHALKNLSWPFGAQKQLEQARKELAEAQSIWRELGNLQKLAEAYRLMLIIHSLIGDHRSILVDASKLSELGASIGSRLDDVEPLYWLSSVQIRQGRFGQVLENLEQVRIYVETLGHSKEKHDLQYARTLFYLAVGALDEAERWADELYAGRETVPPNFITPYFVQVARTKIALGKLDEGRAILDELLTALPYDAIWSYNIIEIALEYGRIHLALGQPKNLFAGLEERMQPYREAGFGRLLADELWLRGRAALALGQYDAARASLLKAQGAAEAQEERAILWKILATQSDLEKACGDIAASDMFRSQARDMVQDIAAHAGEMRDVFLSQPAVVKLLGEH